MLQSVKPNNTPRPILLCPGPVMLSKPVREAVANTTIGHREPEFSQLLAETTAMIKPVVGIEPDDPAYQTAIITGSGTAANETLLATLSQLGRILVLSNGEFGERLVEVSSQHSTQVDHLKFKWQQRLDLPAIEQALQSRRYGLVAMVHHETSTGLLNPVGEVARLAHRYGAAISVDTVSSIGAELIAAKAWDVDALTGSSGKALSAMPGAGIVVIKTSLLNRLNPAERRCHYLDLHQLFAFMQNRLQTPNTPAVHVFVSLHAALNQIRDQGAEAFRGVIHHRALYTRRRLKKMGLQYADYGLDSSSVITCVTLPEYLSFAELSAHLKRQGIVVYNGKGPLKDHIFQIGHIGALKYNDTAFALDQLEQLLARHMGPQQLTHPSAYGQGVVHA
jgi:2-aminoethylphosphonate-pyruvate transaminase